VVEAAWAPWVALVDWSPLFSRAITLSFQDQKMRAIVGCDSTRDATIPPPT